MEHLADEIVILEPSDDMSLADPSTVSMEDVGEAAIEPATVFGASPVAQTRELHAPIPPANFQTDPEALRHILGGYEQYHPAQAQRVAQIAQNIVLYHYGTNLADDDAVRRARVILAGE